MIYLSPVTRYPLLLMRVFNNFAEAKAKIKNAVVTTGSFDGVHIGHKEIVKRLNSIAQDIGGESVVVTFNPHPRILLYPDQKDLKLINTLEEKTMLLERAGLKNLIVVNFTLEFSKIPSDSFITRHIAGDLGAKVLVASYNHQFGHKRQGDRDFLYQLANKHDFRIEEIPMQQINKETISSTKIRKALFRGDVETANSYLGYEYFMIGNIKLYKGEGYEACESVYEFQVDDSNKLLPPEGAYEIKLSFEDKAIQGKAILDNNRKIVVEIGNDTGINKERNNCMIIFLKNLNSKEP